jgi:hypothetical protein
MQAIPMLEQKMLLKQLEKEQKKAQIEVLKQLLII